MARGYFEQTRYISLGIPKCRTSLFTQCCPALSSSHHFLTPEDAKKCRRVTFFSFFFVIIFVFNNKSIVKGLNLGVISNFLFLFLWYRRVTFFSFFFVIIFIFNNKSILLLIFIKYLIISIKTVTIFFYHVCIILIHVGF